MTGITIYWKDNQTPANQRDARYFAFHIRIIQMQQKNNYGYSKDKSIKFTYGTRDALFETTKGRIKWYGKKASFSYIKENLKSIVNTIFKEIVTGIATNKDGPITLEKIVLAPGLTIKPVTIPNQWDEEKYGVKK